MNALTPPPVLQSFRWPPKEPGTEWLNSTEAAEILGIRRAHAGHLFARDLLPGLRVGHRLWFRRHQVEVVANARSARTVAGRLG